MDISPLQRPVDASKLPLRELAANTHVSEADKVAEVSRQFEAVLLRQILASAQKPIFASTANPQSTCSGIYQDMVTNQLADTISHAKAIGLGDTLAKQMGRQIKSERGNKTQTAPI